MTFFSNLLKLLFSSLKQSVPSVSTTSSVKPSLVSVDMSKQSLEYRCLALSGSFEGGVLPPKCFSTLTGNFDKQGISFGVLQWNLGQGSLQPLLKEALSQYSAKVEEIFSDKISILQSLSTLSSSEGVAFSQLVQENNRVVEPFKSMFFDLGQTVEFQSTQLRAASQIFNRAVALATNPLYSLYSERAVALLFDIRVQNGSISEEVNQLIMKDFSNLDYSLTRDHLEVQKLVIIANRRADAANPIFREDVRTRKLCIAKGEGTVHGTYYNLEQQFNLTLRAV